MRWHYRTSSGAEAFGNYWRFESVPGQPDPLRAFLVRAIDLVGRQQMEIGHPNPEHLALITGRPWTFTASRPAEIAPANHPSMPADLGAFPYWRLTGGDTLTGQAEE